MVMGPQYVPFVIPCKPTAPHVKVELVNQDGEVMLNNISDQKIGFFVKFNETHDGFFKCRGKTNKTEQDKNLAYEVIRTSKNFLFIDVQKIFNRKYLISYKNILQHLIKIYTLLIPLNYRE